MAVKLPFPYECPSCKVVFNTLSAPLADDEEMDPKPGAMILCQHCGQWCIFKKDRNGFREPTDREKELLSKDPDAQKMFHLWAARHA
jgi:hypothetical protein